MTRAGEKLYSDEPRLYAVPVTRLDFWRWLILAVLVGGVIGAAIRG